MPVFEEVDSIDVVDDHFLSRSVWGANVVLTYAMNKTLKKTNLLHVEACVKKCTTGRK